MSQMISQSSGQGVPRGAWALLLGQTLSLFGSSLARFGAGVWVYQATGSVSAFSTIAILAMLPGIIASPWAGALVDRWPKRWVIIGSDIAAAVGTGAIFAAVLADGPVLWVIYLATALTSIADAFQWPALGAAVPRLVPAESLSRFNGLLETARSLSQVAAPALAGLLLGLVGLQGLVAVELVTCALSSLILMFWAFPEERAARVAVAARAATNLRQEIGEGIAFIRNHFGLRYLLGLFVLINFFASIGTVLQQPFSLSTLSATKAGVVEGAFGVGMVLGGMVLGAWGGPRRKASAVAWFAILEGLLFCLNGFQTTFVGLVAVAVGKGFVLPFINGCSQTVWQTNTPLQLQGRVFSVRRMLAWITNPFAFALAAPIAVVMGGLGMTLVLSGMGLVVVAVGVLLSGRLKVLDPPPLEQPDYAVTLINGDQPSVAELNVHALSGIDPRRHRKSTACNS